MRPPVWTIIFKQRSNEEVAGETSYRGKTAGVCHLFRFCSLYFAVHPECSLGINVAQTSCDHHKESYTPRLKSRKVEEPGSLMTL